ncbi:MAG TPA: D-2-hydroxyacid dehydrogenase [Candidatus Limnocylindrales bacterium]|jgi:phosphoglycerate dehydrogenase-like enzyme|nr:D-2-hydroxyacid dehydrogenase [Candidatus Limnocylindrales bacterium]
MVRVLVLGATEAEPPPGLPETQTGATYRFADDAAELAASLPEVDAIFHWADRTELLRAVWPTAGRLRWIHAAGVGVDWALFPELIDSEVVVTNSRGVFDETMPEYALALLLALAKDLPATIDDQRARRWRHRPLTPLRGRRATVVGLGSIGRATARLLRAVGMEVVVVGRTAREDPELGRIRASTELAEVAAETDALVLVTPLTDETRGLVDQSVLAALPPGSLLVNIGRGAVVDEAALIESLESGRLGGAALDVFATEPLPPDHPLWAMSNVIVSPHIGGDAPGWLEWFSRSFLDELERFIAGRPFNNVVDKRLGYVPS